MSTTGSEAPAKTHRTQRTSTAFRALAVAALLAAVAPLAGAAPAASIGAMTQETESSVLKVHGFHQQCARDRYGWHRHNQWGERRSCRQWRGPGPRPDFCVQIGPIWICDY
jgi:hypothetical protein